MLTLWIFIYLLGEKKSLHHSNHSPMAISSVLQNFNLESFYFQTEDFKLFNLILSLTIIVYLVPTIPSTVPTAAGDGINFSSCV